MQTWHLFPILILPLIIIYVVVMQKKAAKSLLAVHSGALARVTAEFAAQRRAGESDPQFIVVLARSMFKAQFFMLGVTNQRLLLAPHDGPLRAFDPGSYGLTMVRQTWMDGGHGNVTHSSGLEATFTAGSETHVWRIYNEVEGFAPQAANLPAFAFARC